MFYSKINEPNKFFCFSWSIDKHDVQPKKMAAKWIRWKFCSIFFLFHFAIRFSNDNHISSPTKKYHIIQSRLGFVFLAGQPNKHHDCNFVVVVVVVVFTMFLLSIKFFVFCFFFFQSKYRNIHVMYRCKNKPQSIIVINIDFFLDFSSSSSFSCSAVFGIIFFWFFQTTIKLKLMEDQMNVSIYD